MATSGSVDFSLNTNQLIEKAFHILGKASEGEAMTARMYEDGRSSLNLLLKTGGAMGRLWTKTERTVTLIASTASYALTPKPGRVLSVRIRSGNTDTPLVASTREEYWNLPDKGTTGTPSTYYYDPQSAFGTLYVWPPPSSAVASGQTLYLTYLRRIEDMDASGDDLDMPQEWLETVAWNLASALETEYPVNDDRIAQKIDARAAFLLRSLTEWDQEDLDSVFVQVPVIAEAFELIGKTGITAEDYARAKRSLDNLISSLTAMDHMWARTEGSVTLVSGQASYALSPKAQKVLSVRKRTASVDTPLNRMTRAEYFNVPTKSTKNGSPTGFYYDPQKTTGTLYVWPTPDSTAASGTTLNYTYLRVLAAFDGTTLDVPAEWTEAVAFNLAARLKLKWPMQDAAQAALIDARAEQLFALVKEWDREDEDSVYIQIPVIAEAFEHLGRTNITAEDYARAKRTLNYLIGSWSAMEHLWTRTEGTVTLVSGQQSYTLSPKAQRVLSVRRRKSSLDTPLREMSRQEYYDLPDKTTSPSTPVSWYYDPQVSTGTLLVWPAPSSTVASGTTLAYTYLRALASFDDETLDLPAEWNEAVSLNLAARLKLKYPLDDKERSALIDARAKEAYGALCSWDTEPASLFMQPGLG